ncbi:hypothetical protein ACX0MV_05545 [Pseudomonas borbori]
MIETSSAYADDLHGHTNNPGVSWRAIVAGAVGAAALSLILILLGVGFGFTAVSPWFDSGVSAETLGISAILWLTLTQVAASGLGGYLAGRLRVRWAYVHSDEVFFRDTAHGFLAWSLATLLTAALVMGSVGSVLSGGLKAGAAVAFSAASGAAGMVSEGMQQTDEGSLDYYIDTLFREEGREQGGGGQGNGVAASSLAMQPAPQAGDEEAMRAEALRIFMTSSLSAQGQLSDEDQQYLAQVVSQRTGLSPQEAEQRVEQAYARAIQALEDAKAAVQAAAESAREVAAWSALWMFVALLCGAFVASLAATFGGKQRDHVALTRT